MARELVAPANLDLVNPELAAPRRFIQAGSSTNVGHWQDAARTANVYHAAAGAGQVAGMVWADGQFSVSDGASPGVERLRFPVPFASTDHSTMTCAVYGSSATGNGRVVFTCADNGNTATVVLQVAAGMRTATLDLSGATPALYYDIKVECIEDCAITSFDCTVNEPSGVGAGWPGADDVLAAGEVTSRGGAIFTPMDPAAVAADRPASSHRLKLLRANLNACRERRKVLGFWCGVRNAATADLYEWPAPHYLAWPIPLLDDPQEITAVIRVASAGSLYGFRFYVGSVSLGSIVKDSGGYQSKAITIPSRHDLDAPGDYPGFVVLRAQPILDHEIGLMEPITHPGQTFSSGTADASNNVHAFALLGAC